MYFFHIQTPEDIREQMTQYIPIRESGNIELKGSSAHVGGGGWGGWGGGGAISINFKVVSYSSWPLALDLTGWHSGYYESIHLAPSKYRDCRHCDL